MGKYAICVLANAMPLFETMLATYPQELKNDKFDLVVVNETRIGDKTSKIKELLQKYDIYNSKVLTDKDINAKVKECIVDVPFVDECFFTMNILPLWYLFKFDIYEKLLLLDDDILLQTGVSTLFNSQKSMFQHYFLGLGTTKFDSLNDAGKALHIDTMMYTDLPTTKEFHDNVFIKNNLNGGNRYVVKAQYKEDIYEKALYGFFTSKATSDFWNSGKSPYNGNLDERFESAVFYAMGITNDDLKKVVKHLWCKPEKLSRKSIENLKNALIIHYPMHSHKLQFLQILMDVGYLPYVKDVYNAKTTQNRTNRRTSNFTVNCD